MTRQLQSVGDIIEELKILTQLQNIYQVPVLPDRQKHLRTHGIGNESGVRVFSTKGQWSVVWQQLVIFLPLKLVGRSQCWARNQCDRKKRSVKSDHVDNDNDKPIKVMKMQALPDKGVKGLGGWDQLKKRHSECWLINPQPYARFGFFFFGIHKALSTPLIAYYTWLISYRQLRWWWWWPLHQT